MFGEECSWNTDRAAGEIKVSCFGDFDNLPPEAEALWGLKGHLKECLTVPASPWDFSKVHGGKQVSHAILPLAVLSAYGIGAESTSSSFLKFIIGLRELQCLKFFAATYVEN